MTLSLSDPLYCSTATFFAGSCFNTTWASSGIGKVSRL